MNKNKLLVVSIVACILILSIPLGVFAISEQSKTSIAGDLYQTLLEENNKEILATYNGQHITTDVVEYTIQMNNLYNASEVEGLSVNAQKRKAIDDIIKSIIMLEEAERRGLGATDREIEATIKNTISAYEVPEGKEMIDDYCASLNITFEEYLEMIAEQSPRTIARQKLRDALGKEYCENNGLEYTKINPPDGMAEAVDAAIEELVEANRSGVTYYIEEAE